MRKGLAKAFLIPALLLASACAQSAHQSGRSTFEMVVPAGLREQVDRSVSFPELKAEPVKYQGRVVIFGGVVLNAKRTQDRTELEILQEPLNAVYAPNGDRTQSQGRFLAYQKEFIDPATITTGMLVTVIGQVQGAAVKPLDDTSYSYPVLEIKQLKQWLPGPYPNGYARRYPYSPDYYDQYYGGYGGPFWGPGYYGGYYPYWYAVPVIPVPAPAPSDSRPPQFKK
jgi:outer membrane lipoprotein